MEFIFLILVLLAVLPVAGLAFGIGWLVWQVVKGLIWSVANLGRGIGFLVGHIVGTLRNLVLDILRCVGALLTATLILPLILVNLLLFRFRAAGYYGRACEDELFSSLLGLYRVGLSHPLRLVGLGTVLDGLERRLPAVIDREPGRGRPKKETFPGYKVKGSLPTGGSGASLFLAKPLSETVQRWGEAGWSLPERVVIKSFALERGSTLPQIVRESRALEAAGRLGLVYDHELADDRFYYVMEYVDGEELGQAVRRLHARQGPEGLGEAGLERVLGWSENLLATLDRFHTGGLWHKDVKPSNLIVDGDRLQLVDFGLVTPLASCNTLTTHGTEFYRDPELVRLAMKGVKVHEVDGVKFDLYSAGAVLYSMLEDSFPAQGGLSRFAKRAPESLRWIARRAMADIDERYDSAGAMLADLRHVRSAEDPWAVQPADLPSSLGVPVEPSPEPEPRPAPPALVPVTGSRLATGQHGTRSRRGRRVAAAAGLLGLGFFGTAALMAERMGHAHARSQSHYFAAVHPEVQPPRLMRLNPEERQVFQLAHHLVNAVSPPTPQEIEALTQKSPKPRPKRAKVQAPAGSLPTERFAQSSLPILVLSDVSAPVEPETQELIEEMLAAEGLSVFGQESPLSRDEELIIADVRHQAGLGGVRDDDACRRLLTYLADHPHLGGILWVAAGDTPEHLFFRALTPETAAAIQR